MLVEATNLNQLKHKIEEVITTAQDWYSKNSMLNNISKTEVMMIRRGNADMSKEKISVIDDGNLIQLIPKESMKILGVTIDENLNWNKQTNNVKKKAFYATRCTSIMQISYGEDSPKPTATSFRCSKLRRKVDNWLQKMTLPLLLSRNYDS